MPTGRPGPIDLRLDGDRDPTGVDDRRPQFSWRFDPDGEVRDQSVYRILVASAPDLLNDEVDDVWDTGWVDSGQSTHVPYEGEPLRPDERYYWSVRVSDGTGEPTGWSEPASWRTGLFGESDWVGDWIGPGEQRDYDPPHAGLLLGKEFAIDGDVAAATAYVSGVGYAELSLNGCRVSDRELDPAFTDYRERVPYTTHDVTDSLEAGRNAIGVHLGGGWFDLATPDLFGFEDSPWTGPPRVRFQLEIEFTDGRERTIASDDTWRWTTGPVRFNCVRGGETFDARETVPGWDEPGAETDDWREAESVAAPEGDLVAQRHPPCRAVDTLRATDVTEPEPGVYVFDFGRNVAGWPKLVAGGGAGQEITMRCAETLTDAGTIDEEHGTTHTHGRYQTETVVLDGDGEVTYEPRFTYHGFQYVQVTGLDADPSPETVRAREVHTDFARSGGFDCSHDRISDAMAAFDNAYRNYHHHHPADPIREKTGWTHDAFVEFEPGAFLYGDDAVAVYRKWLADMADGQEPNGHVPPIVPTNGWGTTDADGSPPDYSDPWWGGAVVYLPWYLYEHTGDATVLEDHYDAMGAWVEYLRGRAEDDLIDWWLGDWLEVCPDSPDSRGHRTPIIQTSTCGYYYAATLLARAARVLDRADDAERYADLADRIAEGFNDAFLDADAGRYAADSQTAQALPLWLGMVPDDHEAAVFDTLVADVEEKGHLTTGFVGTKPLLRVLTARGRADLAYAVTVREAPPSFLGLLVNDDTSFRESWTGRPQDVHNIPNLAACFVDWFVRGVAGIRPVHGREGPEAIRIAPAVVEDLGWARGSYESVYGDVESAWSLEDERLELDVAIPPNCPASVSVPTTDRDAIRIDGTRPVDHDRVVGVETAAGRTDCRVAAGQFGIAVDPFDPSTR